MSARGAYIRHRDDNDATARVENLNDVLPYSAKLRKCRHKSAELRRGAIMLSTMQKDVVTRTVPLQKQKISNKVQPCLERRRMMPSKRKKSLSKVPLCTAQQILIRSHKRSLCKYDVSQCSTTVHITWKPFFVTRTKSKDGIKFEKCQYKG